MLKRQFYICLYANLLMQRLLASLPSTRIRLKTNPLSDLWERDFLKDKIIARFRPKL